MSTATERSPQEQSLLPNAPSNAASKKSRSKGSIDKGADAETPTFLPWDYFTKPLSVYSKNRTGNHYLRFRRPEEAIPLFLNILLGLQHAAVACCDVMMAPILLHSGFRTNFGKHALESALVISGVCSLLQCMQIKIPGTPYQIGTGLCSFVGNSLVFGTMNITLIQRLVTDDGISIDEAYGKILGTTAVCTLVFLALSLVPRKYVRSMFPPVVSGIIIILVGLDCYARGYKYWSGHSDCSDFATDCPSTEKTVPPYGLGLLVLVLLVLTEFFGTAFMRQNRIAFCVGIPFALTAIITKDSKENVSTDYPDNISSINFLWTTNFKWGFDKDLVLPLIGAYLVIYLQATAVLTGTLEESGLDIKGQDADRRIQGGLISMSLGSFLSVLATALPVGPIPENNSFVYMSRVASRAPATFGALFILALGIFGNFTPDTGVPMIMRGGIVVMLAATVIILGGIRILSREKLDRRASTIIIYALTFGIGSFMVQGFVNNNLWLFDANESAFLHYISFAMISLMQVPYFLGGTAAIALHLTLPNDPVVDEMK